MNIWPFRRRSVPACGMSDAQTDLARFNGIVVPPRQRAFQSASDAAPMSRGDSEARHREVLHRLDNLHALVASLRTKPRPRAGKRRARK